MHSVTLFRTRKTLHSRPSTPPHHSTWTGSIAKLSENRSGCQNHLHFQIGDLCGLDILEEIKSFRWYYDNAPLARVKNVRLALRRWIANANGPRYR